MALNIKRLLILVVLGALLASCKVAVDVEEGGYVTTDWGPVCEEGTCTYEFPPLEEGRTYTTNVFTAIADDGYVFAGWIGLPTCEMSGGPVCSFDVTRDASAMETTLIIRAQFDRLASAEQPETAITVNMGDGCGPATDLETYIETNYRFFDITGGVVWPNGLETYTLDTLGEWGRRSLSCAVGSTICYAAQQEYYLLGNRTAYYGLDLITGENVAGCLNCCKYCEEGLEWEIELTCSDQW